MERKYVGKSVKRIEDPRLLTGQALFTDDVHIEGMLHVAFLRSDYAHAKIVKLDVSEALKRPGVVMVLTAADFGDYYHVGPLFVPPPLSIPGASFHTKGLPPVAKDFVRYSGEPLAVIVAESRSHPSEELERYLAGIRVKQRQPLSAMRRAIASVGTPACNAIQPPIVGTRTFCSESRQTARNVPANTTRITIWASSGRTPRRTSQLWIGYITYPMNTAISNGFKIDANSCSK